MKPRDLKIGDMVRCQQWVRLAGIVVDVKMVSQWSYWSWTRRNDPPLEIASVLLFDDMGDNRRRFPVRQMPVSALKRVGKKSHKQFVNYYKSYFK